MNELFKPKPKTVDEFIPWAMAQPRGRYELLDGEVVMMGPERLAHVRAKTSAYIALAEALKRASLSCEAMGDGVTVRINERTAYEPDALVYCGPRLGGGDLEVPNPVVVVEVSSPTTFHTDTGYKFTGYFSLPSVRHYLIVDVEKRAVIHHARGGNGQIASSTATQGSLRLDPPGIEVIVADLLPPVEPSAP
jgi:Uma2 family endonuclease